MLPSEFLKLHLGFSFIYFHVLTFFHYSSSLLVLIHFMVCEKFQDVLMLTFSNDLDGIRYFFNKYLLHSSNVILTQTFIRLFILTSFLVVINFDKFFKSSFEIHCKCHQLFKKKLMKLRVLLSAQSATETSVERCR